MRIRGAAAASPMAASGAAVVLVLVLTAVVAPWISPAAPDSMDFGAVLTGPSVAHPFGTDNFGRDVFTRVVYGFRVSLAVALGSVAIAMAIGVPLGLVAGYRRGWVEAVITRPTDVLLAFPAIVLVVALAGLMGQNVWLMMVAIAFVYSPVIVRVMRGAALEVADAPFIEGARARGASHLRVMVRHVLPNAFAPVLVQASALMGIAILLEAALSFIGLGIQPPTPSLGLMLAEGRSFMKDAPWLVITPGLGILVAVLGFNLVGDGLPRLMDPARRGR